MFTSEHLNDQKELGMRGMGGGGGGAVDRIHV